MPNLSLRGLILVPAIVTLGVTLLRNYSSRSAAMGSRCAARRAGR